MLTLAQVQSKSLSKLAGLNPIVRQITERLINQSFHAGVPIVITQGLRTIAQQNQLYAQGRTTSGAIVTNARGGYSYHNYGLAIDFALLLPDGAAVSWDISRDGDGDRERDWLEVAQLGKSLGFEWGGDWTSYVDMPHFQITFGLKIAQLRAGVKPPTKMIEEDAPMTKEERAAFDTVVKKVDDLTSQVGTLVEKLGTISELVEAPKWFVKEFGSADLGGLINEPKLAAEGWRVLAIGLRADK